jgi:hypothetical protein
VVANLGLAFPQKKRVGRKTFPNAKPNSTAIVNNEANIVVNLNIHRPHGEGGGWFLVLTPTTVVGTNLTFICKINFPLTT